MPSSNRVSTDPIARLCDVTVSYGRRMALDSLSLTLQPAKICALMGPNGSGKSTLGRLLCGLIKPDRGRILHGSDATAASNVGLVPQDIAVYPFMTAKENCIAFARLAGLDRARAHAAAERALALAACDSIADLRVGRLSGGFKRRVNIAVALTTEPTLLVLDEPTAGIDLEARQAIGSTLETLRSIGTAVLLITHDFSDADRLADQVVFLRAGKLVAAGAPAHLLMEEFGRRRRLDVSFAAEANPAQQILLVDLGASRTGLASWLMFHESQTWNAADVAAALTRAGLVIKELRFSEPGLETLYAQLNRTPATS